jgi:uncharacterized paraquat-inducible protein A
MALLALQSCPSCRSRVPLIGVTHTNTGAQLWKCPKCGARLSRKSDYRLVLSPLLAGAAIGTIAFLPLWMWLPFMAGFLIWDIRWTLELDNAPDDAPSQR